jgi:hypothetical protein
MDGVQTPESTEATQQQAPARWHAEPTGRHESRYSDRECTQQVSTRGVNSIDTHRRAKVPRADAAGEVKCAGVSAFVPTSRDRGLSWSLGGRVVGARLRVSPLAHNGGWLR